MNEKQSESTAAGKEKAKYANEKEFFCFVD